VSTIVKYSGNTVASEDSREYGPKILTSSSPCASSPSCRCPWWATTKGRYTSAQNRDTLGHCQGTYPARAFLAKEESSGSFFYFIDRRKPRSFSLHSVRRGSCLLSRSFSVSVCLSRRRYRDRCAGISPLFNAFHRRTSNVLIRGTHRYRYAHNACACVVVITNDVWCSVDAETYSYWQTWWNYYYAIH